MKNLRHSTYDFYLNTNETQQILSTVGSLLVKTSRKHPLISFRVRLQNRNYKYFGELVAYLDARKFDKRVSKLDFKTKNLHALNFAVSLLYRKFITNNLGSVISSIAYRSPSRPRPESFTPP